MDTFVDNFMHTVKSSTGTVAAEVWELEVCGGWLEFTHGFKTTIRELHIPSAGISINYVEGEIHCFRTGDRYSRGGDETDGGKKPSMLGETQVPSSIVLAALGCVASRELMDEHRDTIESLTGQTGEV